MKKFISVSVALLLSVAVFSQEDQVKDAEKAFKKGDLEATASSLKSAQIDEDKLWSYDPEVISDYLFIRGQVCMKNGESGKNPEAYSSALKYFNLLLDFEKGQYHRAKNIESGDYEFFASQEEMDAAINAKTHKKGKSKDIKDYHSKEIQPLLKSMVLNVHQSAIDTYNEENFASSRMFFVLAFDIYSNPLVGNADTTLIYNAASVAVSEGNYMESIKLYESLLAMNYTGVKTVYEAVNKQTGEKSPFNNKKDRDTQVNFGLYDQPSEYVTENAQPGIYSQLASLYGTFGDEIEDENDPKKKEYYHKSVEVLQEGRVKFPSNQKLLLALGNFYLKEGNQQAFIDAMKEAAVADPTNEILFYNIGVISAQLGLKAEAKEAYNKAIELKPDYIDAYINMAALILDKEKEINQQISDLPIRLNKKNRDKLNRLEKEKKDIYKEAVTYLEKAYSFQSDNRAVLQTLKNIYYSLDRNEDFMKMKKELDALDQ
jgi:tetratricopeptide (TPR) repeat protein